ncbi:hypothetical protein HK57_00031 [Aspergillus ustus]|uniref:Zn(2)-C6 fungal-type domain-containing protein n=1 Tax=Aspergillus ustus TaxID=40382 RepID=A0A0C1E1N6_ASPUT|nr:hypothetical protein HK57_00031 [Aspergillus ustus]
MVTLAPMPVATGLIPTPDSYHGLERPTRRRKACDNCRRRKERCDGLEPCGRCKRRRVDRECRRLFPGCGPSQQQRKSSLSSADLLPTTAAPNPLPATHTSSSPFLTTISTDTSTFSSSKSIIFHTTRLIRNSHGGYTVHGPSANLSVVQSVRQVVHSALGACPFTEERPEGDLIDEQITASANWTDLNAEPQRPSPADARYYLKWYASATSCVFDLFEYDHLEAEIITWLDQPPSGHANSCVYFLVLAIGAQCAPQDHDTRADSYFAYGQHLASTKFLGTASMSTVRIYCLITMYLLSACQPNAASMHLSVATRAAHGLGIHRADISALFSATETSNRERVWKVLRVLDLFLSTCLGQQPSTTETRDTNTQQEYSASTDLCNIFEKILSEIYTKQKLSPTALQHVSRHHREWASRFRDGLMTDHIPAEEESSPSGDGNTPPNIGLCHLKGAYYWTILLVTRPYLLNLVQTHVSSAVHSVRSPDTHKVYTHFGLDSDSDSLLAHASVNSAVLSIDLLQGLLEADDIPKRLPYVVNSVLNSALVLGLGFFADLDRLFPLSYAMGQAEKLLDRFQAHDPFAKWSLQIVQNLHNSCNDFVRQRCERHLKRQRALVEGLFGEVKSCFTGERPSPRSPRQANGHADDIPFDNQGMNHMLNTPPTDLWPSLQFEENSVIWSQLFCDEQPDQLWQPAHQAGEAGHQWT